MVPTRPASRTFEFLLGPQTSPRRVRLSSFIENTLLTHFWTAYSYDDTSGDVNLNDFNIGAAPSYVFSTLRDILSINQWLRVHVVPWSPVSISIVALSHGMASHLD